MSEPTQEQIEARAEYWKLRAENPGKVIEWRTKGAPEGCYIRWVSRKAPEFDSKFYQFRVQPEPGRVGRYPQVDLPMPESKEPESGTPYYRLGGVADKGYTLAYWDSVDYELTLLANGAVYLSEDDVKLVAENSRLVAVES